MRTFLSLFASTVVLAACGGGTKKSDTTPPASSPASSAAMAAPTVGGAQMPVPQPTPAKAPEATATLDAKSGSGITGSADFVQKDDGSVVVTISIANATPGQHGVHVHETGDCSAPDAKSAGGHYNPDKTNHGAPGAMPHHSGDLGNLVVGADGKGTLTLTTKDLSVAAGPHSVDGKSVIVHAGADDLKSQPAGNSGARAACGVIHALTQ